MFDIAEQAGFLTAATLLSEARAERAAADLAEARLLHRAVQWADMHPAESIESAAVQGRVLVDGAERALAIAGPGCPLVAEFCIDELAAALGLRTEQGRDLVGEAVELAHRLLRVWARVGAGELQAWRARRIARQTISLSREAAAHVDAHLAPAAHTVGLPTVERLVAEAVARFMPGLAEQQAREAADRRCVEIDARTVSFDGTVRMFGELDLADALDLDAALTAGAESLAAAGSDETRQVRRSVALGDLARGTLPLPLAPAPYAPPAPAAAPRRVVLHVHLSEAAVGGPSGIVRMEGTAGQGGRHLVTVGQVREWCRTAGSVTVAPVLDVADRLHVEAYEVPDRMRAQAAERDIGCVFPWCTRPASACDDDHVVPYCRGGPTATDNLAPLCRHHHRLKTHSGWTSTVVEPGTYLWRSRLGQCYLTDPTGTRRA